MKSITKFHNEIIKIVGPDFVLTNPNDILPYLHEERGLKKSNADIVVRPESVSYTHLTLPTNREV